MEAVATARTMGLANTARLGLAAAGETAVVAGVTGLAVASVGWAVEDTRRALRGQPTLTDEAVDFWRREGLVGGMSQFGNELWDFVNE